MTVETDYAPLTYNGNGVANNFPVTWPFFTGSLVVTRIVSGVETELTINVDYTVTGGTDGEGKPGLGSVIFGTAPASGTQIRIERDTPLTQGSTWEESDNFPQAVVESALDKNILIAQEIASKDWTGPQGPQGPAGPEWLDWQGSWSAGTYNEGDGVEHNGSTYRANTTTSQEPPHADWDLVASKGQDGMGTGDVVGPSSSTNNNLAVFDGTTGKLIKDGGITIASVMSALAARAPATGYFFKADPMSVVFVKTGAGTINVKAGTKVEVNGAVIEFATATAVTMPALTAGTDYAIYVCDDGEIVADASFTAPTGYTTTDSRQIGGFHYAPGGNATGTSGGDTTPAINEYSLWDLKWRPACPDPRGMTLVNDSFWVDIYLTGVDHHVNGTSKYNVTIADGSSPPKIPTVFGGNGSTTYSTFTWYEANEVMQSHGKDLLSYGEFSMAAQGTTEETSGGTDPVSTILREEYTSKWGVMLSTGNVWVWSRDFGYIGDGSTSFSWHDVAGSKGNVSTQGTYGLAVARLGGGWDNAANAGSRASAWSDAPWSSSGGFGARGRCDHLRLV